MKKNLSLYPRLALILAFTICIPLMLISQKTVSGIISDASSGETLIGATITVPNSSIGTTTDIDGAYTLSVEDNVTELIISYTGYESMRLTIPSTNILSAALAFGEILDDVVIIGYGEVRREDATGSIQSISSKDFNKGAITGPEQLLAGKIAGVSITTDGGPGSGSTIRIRGQSSLLASNDPLIVVDGIPLSGSSISGGRNPLNIINPNDIESMTVLKDASATAIYGNRASGGVILITTKKGKLGTPFSIGYTGNISIGKTIDRVDVLNATDFKSIVTERFGEGSTEVSLLGDSNTDWQEEVFQQAIGTDHNLSISGAIGSVPIRASLGYTSMNGLIKTDKFDRLSGSLNLNPRLIDNRLQLNLGLKTVNTKNHFADRGAIGNAMSFNPTQSVLDASSPYGGFTTWTIANGNPNTLAPTNPVALLELRDDISTVNRYIASASADYRFAFLPALRANLNLAYDFSNGSGTINVPQSASFAFDDLNGGGVNNIYDQTSKNSLLEFFLNYKKELGLQEFEIMAGYSWQHFHFDDSFTNSDVNGTASETSMGSDPSEYYLGALFARLNYNLDRRYLLTFTVRRDGVSRFSPENRWGLFPAAAFAVKLLDNENRYFNNVKLRLGWGSTGQQSIGDDYAYQGRYQYGDPNAQYQFGNTFISTLRPNGYDEGIKWEETSTINLGLDYSIISDRLSGSIDIYRRKTKDLLNRIPIPAGTNLTNFITTNVGDMKNQGIELALNVTPISRKNIRWDFNINGAYNKNEITKLTATDDPTYNGILTGGIAGGVGSNIQIHSVGFSPSSFYVFEQLYDESGNILEGEFADRNEDGLVNEDDKYRFEKPFADVSLGLTSNLTIHNFDFSFAGRANLGNYMYNNIETSSGYYERLYNSTGILNNIHSSAITNNVVNQSNLTFSDHYVQDASFFKLDHITIGYTFNELIGKSFRIYSTIQNALTLTGYSGLDPEVFGGIDNNIYPRSRTLIFGFSVDF